MLERSRLIADFLADAGWHEARRSTLAGDASFRRYDRLVRGGETAVLMDAPPPHENVLVFHRVQGLLSRLGFSAPRSYKIDAQAGFILQEDLGDITFTRALAEGADEARLYRLATDLLIALHRAFSNEALAGESLPPYDDTRLLAEAALLVDWYLPAVIGAPTPPGVRESYFAAWREVLPEARRIRDSLVLRDYHVDNLMVLDGRSGLAACGLLDFQDAVIGPMSYDLVSLLEDARRDVSVRVVREMFARYLAAFPAFDAEAFLASYKILGAQRSAKIIGIFTRLSQRDGKSLYLHHIPRVWRLLEEDLRHTALAPVAAWFACEIAATQRRAPPEGRAP